MGEFNQNDYSKIHYSVRYTGLNRKRQVIDAIVNELHTMQLDMVDQAVEHSNLEQAKEVIKFIKEKL